MIEPADVFNWSENPILSAALEYCKNGIPVFPVKNKKCSIPSWKEFQSRLPSIEEIMGWSWVDIALPTGEISDTTVVDCDYPDLAEKIQEEMPVNTRYIVQRTKNEHWHYIFKFTPGISQSQDGGVDDHQLHVRSNGGYIVIAPSDGYSLSEPLTDTSDLDPVPPEIQKLLPTRAPMAGSDNNGLKNDPGWQKGILGGVIEGNRNAAITKEAGRLVQKFLSREEALPVLLRMNENCSPPLGQKEVEGILDSVIKTDKRNNPCRIEVVRTPLDFSNPLPAGDPMEPIRFCDVSFPPREHIIKGFPLDMKLAYTHAAGGGEGKSFVALSLLKSVATGLPLFGKFEVLQKGPVLLFDSETPEPIMIERLNGFGLRDPSIDAYLIHFSGLRVDELQGLLTIQAMVEKYKPVLCIFDSLTRFHSAEENSNTEMKNVMNSFRSISNMGPAIWLIHHVNKETRSTRGAAEIVNAIDMEFRSTSTKDGLITLGTGKCRIERPDQIILKSSFEPGNYSVKVSSGMGGELWDDIQKVLSEAGRPMVVKDILERLSDLGIDDPDHRAVRNILNRMVSMKIATKEFIEVEQKHGSRTRKLDVIHYGL